MRKRVMVSPLAGRWYQDSEMALRYELQQLTKDITVVRRPKICAAVVPHAGYRYSGKIAAGVYARIDPRQIRRIIIIGPSHYVNMPNQISIPDATHISTPLGELLVDYRFVEKARQLPFIIHEPQAHRQEHSDQIQLPLIQTCLGTKIPIVCMVCGQFTPQALLDTGSALRDLLDEGTLIVASTDFTHHGANYGYEPFTNNVQERVESLDLGIFDLFVRKDLAGFLEILEQTGATVCGRDPLALLLTLLPGGAKVERTGYDTSGRQTRDDANSVSYLGAIVTGTWPAKTRSAAANTPAAPLPPADGKRLLQLARLTVETAVQQGEEHARMLQPPLLSAGMEAVRGGFVTLKLQGQLRGCIGEILPRRPIWQVVRDQAINAALHDPRFNPVTQAELQGLEFELSILTPPQPIASWRAIELGRHGILLSRGNASAVFLPQVAPEQGWDLETTLTHLALKAGLSAEAWRTDTEFLTFEAQIF